MRKLTEEEKLVNIETMKHILTVRTLLLQCIQELTIRGNEHDISKLFDPEVALFTKYTPLLKDVEYGSEQYKEFLKELKPALDNHYKLYSHHPEHFPNGINGMNLFDLIEMMCDWKAASLRTSSGELKKSLLIQKEKLGISEQLYNIMYNTIYVLEIMSSESYIDISYPQNGN